MIDLDKLKRTINFAAAVAVDAGQQNLANNLDECVHQIELIEKRAIAAELLAEQRRRGAENIVNELALADRQATELKAKLAEIEKQEHVQQPQELTDITSRRWSKEAELFGSGVQQSQAISKMETTANGLNLRLIEDCLLIYKTQLYFDDYSELRNKVTDQINILAKLNKQGA